MESTNFDTGKTSSCWEKSREIELWVSIVSLDGCLPKIRNYHPIHD